MAESTDSTSEVVKATPPPPSSDTVNNAVDSDTVGSKTDRKSHTPASLSRTQLPPSATPEERASLEKLKQKMEFTDEASLNSPPKSPQLLPNDNSPDEVKKKSLEENGEMSEGEIDTSASMSHVLSRLDQVRHYLEEASDLYKAFDAQESLQPSDQVQMLKLTNLIKHFREQELGYLTLLQRIMNFEQDGNDESGEEETTTAELNTTHDTLTSSLHSDDQQLPTWSSSAPILPTMRTSKPDINNSLSLQSELDRSRDGINENDMSQQEELAVLKEQHALLTRLLHQQQELQQLEARQANLRALKQEAETTLAAARVEMQQANSQQRQQRHTLVDYDRTSSTSENSQSNDEEPQLVELETGMAEMSVEENTGPHSLAALVDEEAEKAALMAKLDDLETRKTRIDQLLMQLRTLQSAESETASAAPMVPAASSVPSDDWLATIDDPLLRERIRQLQIRRHSDRQQQQAQDGEAFEVAEAVQQDRVPSEVVDVTREKDLEEKMRKLEEAKEQLKRLQTAISSYQDMMSVDTGQDNAPSDQAEEGCNDNDELNKSLVGDYQAKLAGLRQEVNELLQQRESLLNTQRMMENLRGTSAIAAAPATHKKPAAAGTQAPPTSAVAAGSNVGGQLSVELMRQKQLYDELVKKTQLLHELQSSATRGTVGSEHDTYSVTSSVRGVSTVEGGGDMTMATWGGSTAQSVDSNEGESDEGEYDNNYEGDTTLQHTGDSAALEESGHATYGVDNVQFRVDRHTPRRRLLTPDSGMVNSSGKKIKLDSQPRTTKFTEPDPTSKYSNPEWVRPVSPRRRYRQSEHELELQQQLVASTNMCNDLLRSQLQLVDVLTYRMSTQMPPYPLGLMQYYDNYHQQLMQYHTYLNDVYQKSQPSFSQQQQSDQAASEQPLDSAMAGQAAAPPPVGTFGVDGQGINMVPGYPFAEGSSSSLYPNPSQAGQYFPGVQSNNTSFNHSFNIPPPPGPLQNVHMSPYPPFDPRFGFYNSPFLARVPGVTPQHNYPWSPLRAYTSPMRPFEVPPPFRGSPVFHFGRTPPYGPGMEPQFSVQTHTSQPVTVYPPQSPSGITAASAQAVAPSTPSARSVSTLQQQQDLNGQQDQGGLLETGPLYSDAIPTTNANMFQTVASSHPTTASVTFGVPTIASMTQKNSSAPKSAAAAATSRPAELTAAYVKSAQTKLEEADSESSMPCSLPDDIANRYARADALGTVSGPTAAAASAAATMNEDLEEEFSLFEALRDSIYSEVATLISNNESRPHFLIELFRELQLLKTDYLRQRALYSIQDLVTRFLTEENLAEEAANPYLHWVESGTDQTPSDSLVTSDDEQTKGKPPQAGAHDYSEPAESATTLSTPPVEPFASDNLGDTVIHLDISKSCSNDSGATQQPMEQATTTDDTSDSSKSDAFSTENISTQALDQQIKNIMIEVIPLLKNRLQSPCSTEFLASIQQFIMNLALKEENQKMEYVQVFTAQLSETLTKTLAKYNGKLLKDCGEELLIDVSEVLFNEMAFLKLMEDVANHPDADILGLPLAQVVEAKSPEKSSCSAAVLQSLASTAMKQLHLEEEELGKDRDDDMANQCEFPAAQELSTVVEVEVSGDTLQQPASDTRHGDESATAEGQPLSEEVNQITSAEEVTSCRSNSTIEPATEPTESVANDSKPSHTGSNDTAVHNDQADTAQTESKPNHAMDNKENTVPVSDTNTIKLDQIVLTTKMEEEQKTTTGLAGVLASISTDTALVGDGNSIKEPTETEP